VKKILYPIFCVLLFISCGTDENEADDILTVTSVDLSDFTIYAGSADGGVKVQYNELKRTELINYFFGGRYESDIYEKNEIQFNNSKLTFVDSVGLKIVSGYIFEGDSLFINKLDAVNDSWNKVFVALGTLDNIYRTIGFSRYRNSGGRDTTRTFFREVLNLDRMLDLRGLSSLSDMTDPKDTLVWCNATYIFK
jgi:hypothetical protein